MLPQSSPQKNADPRKVVSSRKRQTPGMTTEGPKAKPGSRMCNEHIRHHTQSLAHSQGYESKRGFVGGHLHGVRVVRSLKAGYTRPRTEELITSLTCWKFACFSSLEVCINGILLQLVVNEITQQSCPLPEQAFRSRFRKHGENAIRRWTQASRQLTSRTALVSNHHT